MRNTKTMKRAMSRRRSRNQRKQTP